jgi:hypothetical protein
LIECALNNINQTQKESSNVSVWRFKEEKYINMNQLTLKRGLSITRCVVLALCFRVAAILTRPCVLLLKAVVNYCE